MEKVRNISYEAQDIDEAVSTVSVAAFLEAFHQSTAGCPVPETLLLKVSAAVRTGTFGDLLDEFEATTRC